MIYLVQQPIQRREVEIMESEKNRRLMEIESIAKQIVALPEESKPFVMGYMIGKEEERQKWQKQGSTTKKKVVQTV